jgi:DNA-binding transcriptional ArsR family regulator
MLDFFNTHPYNYSMNNSTNKSNAKLTPRGDTTRSRIMRFLEANQVVICPVSVADIAEGTGVSQTTVFHHLEILTRQGRISRPEPKEDSGRRKYNHIELIKQSEDEMLAVMRPISAMESSLLVKWLIKSKGVSEGKFPANHFLKLNVGAVINELKENHIKATEREILIGLRRIFE